MDSVEFRLLKICEKISKNRRRDALAVVSTLVVHTTLNQSGTRALCGFDIARQRESFPGVYLFIPICLCGYASPIEPTFVSRMYIWPGYQSQLLLHHICCFGNDTGVTKNSGAGAEHSSVDWFYLIPMFGIL